MFISIRQYNLYDCRIILKSKLQKYIILWFWEKYIMDLDNRTVFTDKKMLHYQILKKCLMMVR